MNLRHLPFHLLGAAVLSGCTTSSLSSGSSVMVTNPEQGGAIPQLVMLDNVSKLETGEGPKQWPFEWQEKNADNGSQLAVLVDMAPGQQQELALDSFSEAVGSPHAQDRAYAELAVRQGGQWQGTEYVAEGFSFSNVTSFTAPPQLTDHSYYLRYEGPGWENELIGYRLYLDWRNAIDVFVKTQPKLVLSEVGQDGYDNYHKFNDWGADVLKVGKSLGLGALGRLVGSEVHHFQNVDNTRWRLQSDNKLSAGFSVAYDGWEVAGKKIDLTTDYSIHAGDPSTLVEVTLSDQVDDLVTGLVKHPNTRYIQLQQGDWGLIASYGKQSLISPDDELGMAVFYRLDQVAKTGEGEYDYLIHFKPLTRLSYGFLAVWPKHPASPKDEAGFRNLLKEKLRALNFPIQVEEDAQPE